MLRRSAAPVTRAIAARCPSNASGVMCGAGDARAAPVRRSRPARGRRRAAPGEPRATRRRACRPSRSTGWWTAASATAPAPGATQRGTERSCRPSRCRPRVLARSPSSTIQSAAASARARNVTGSVGQGSGRAVAGQVPRGDAPTGRPGRPAAAPTRCGCRRGRAAARRVGRRRASRQAKRAPSTSWVMQPSMAGARSFVNSVDKR